jgi:PST family polysaccharide transporter
MNAAWWRRLAAVAARPTVLRIAQNSSWMLLERGVRLALGLAVGVLVARYLGPDRFGELSYALAVFAIAGAVAGLGLDGVAVRDLVGEPGTAHETLGTCFGLRVCAALCAAALATGVGVGLRGFDSPPVLLIAILSISLFFQAFDVIDLWFQSRLESGYVAAARTVAFVAGAAGRLVLVLISAPLAAFAWIMVAETALAAAALLAAYRARGASVRLWRMRFARTIELIRDGWPLFVSAAVVTVYMRVDQIMLGQLAAMSEVGNYNIAARMVEMVYLLPTVLSASLLPSIVNARHAGAKQYRNRVQLASDVMVWVSLASAVLLSLLARPLVGLLFGAHFGVAGDALTILAWTPAAVFFGILRQKWLIAENRVKDGLLLELIGVAVNVTANLFLIPCYGATGAATASVLTAFTANAFAAVFSRAIRESLLIYARSLAAPLRLARRR